MKNSKFWFLSLVVLLILGVAMQWPIALCVAVVANSLLVLFLIASRVWEAYHE